MFVYVTNHYEKDFENLYCECSAKIISHGEFKKYIKRFS